MARCQTAKVCRRPSVKTMLGDRALACDVGQQFIVLANGQNQVVREDIVIKRCAIEKEVSNLIGGVILVPRRHDEFCVSQIGVNLHVRVVNRVVPCGTIVADANSVSASRTHKREAECVLIGGGNLGGVVDDEDDEIRAVKRRTIKRIG